VTREESFNKRQCSVLTGRQSKEVERSAQTLSEDAVRKPQRSLSAGSNSEATSPRNNYSIN
jgi:hypothetical protein